MLIATPVPVCRDLKVAKGHLVPQVRLVEMARLDLPVHRALLGHLEVRDPLEALAHQDYREMMERR